MRRRIQGDRARSSPAEGCKSPRAPSWRLMTRASCAFSLSPWRSALPNKKKISKVSFEIYSLGHAPVNLVDISQCAGCF